MAEKYSIDHKSVDDILGYIRDKAIAIPEIQRPFVWSGAQVRNLIDSLYKGYPAGYLIVWQNPTVKLKDGQPSQGKKILIDGQQRVTALMAAIDGRPVLNDEYQMKPIKIAFNPWAGKGEDSFEVQTPVHLKDKKWIPDISVLFKPGFYDGDLIDEYIAQNPGVVRKDIGMKIKKLLQIVNRQIGVITLDSSLGIDEVTEIFVRINSQGKVLNEADFAMSKIAADEKFGGNVLRKAIDYFCHLAVKPTFYEQIEKDSEFLTTDFASEIKWLKDDRKDIYDPDYGDILRVALMHKFGRGKLKDLVSLLSGRDFINRVYKEEIVEDSFKLLTEGVHNFVKQYNFEQFVLAIENAGFISPKLLNSQMTLDFAYTLYLYLQESGDVAKQEIPRYVRKWFVLTTLIGRYVGSPESWMDRDLRAFKEKKFLNVLKDLEDSELGESFWVSGLPQALETTSTTSPYFNVFRAAQVYFNEHSLLSDAPVRGLIEGGDVHHIFPKNFLKNNGRSRIAYNQVANYTYLETAINIRIKDAAPNEYFAKAFAQCETKQPEIGLITDIETLRENLATNCVPENVAEMTAEEYEIVFLPARRRMMAAKIRRYYEAL